MNLTAKIGLVAGVVGIIRWIVVYTRLQPWWRDPIGQTLVIKAAMFGVLLALLGWLAYFPPNGIWLKIATWAAVIDICSIGPIMEWRTQVWKRESRAQVRREAALASGQAEGPE